MAISTNPVQKRAAKRAPETRAVEARLLALLCRGECGAGLRDELLTRLAGHAFQYVNHQAVFDCLRELGRENAARIRELLPVRLVQAGFPEVDLAPFFLHEEIDGAEAATLLRKLVASR